MRKWSTNMEDLDDVMAALVHVHFGEAKAISRGSKYHIAK